MYPFYIQSNSSICNHVIGNQLFHHSCDDALLYTQQKTDKPRTVWKLCMDPAAGTTLMFVSLIYVHYLIYVHISPLMSFYKVCSLSSNFQGETRSLIGVKNCTSSGRLQKWVNPHRIPCSNVQCPGLTGIDNYRVTGRLSTSKNASPQHSTSFPVFADSTDCASHRGSKVDCGKPTDDITEASPVVTTFQISV